MRMGNLDAAKESFEKARKRFRGKQPSTTLADNINALNEHLRFREAKSGGASSMQGSSMNQPDGDYDDDYYGDDDDDDDEDASEVGLSESSASSLTDLGIAKAESGDLLEALKLFERAVAADPLNSKQHENLAVTQVLAISDVDLFLLPGAVFLLITATCVYLQELCVDCS